MHLAESHQFQPTPSVPLETLNAELAIATWLAAEHA
jgi:hypothetical protein